MLRTCATALAALVTTSVTLGDLQINQWNPNITSGFTIDENRRIITITSGHPTEVFKFEAYDDSNNEPETINEISVQSGAGTVLLAVIGDPAGERTLGAADLEKLDLSGASSSTLAQVKIDTDLGLVAHPSGVGARFFSEPLLIDEFSRKSLLISLRLSHADAPQAI